MDFKRFANGLSKFANYSSAARGSAACCAESLWLSGQGGILPPPPRHGKAKPFRTAGGRAVRCLAEGHGFSRAVRSAGQSAALQAAEKPFLAVILSVAKDRCI